MKLLRGLALFVSAVFVAKVMVTAFGLLLSIPPMYFELSASEVGLKATYEILAVYFLVVVVLLFITSVSLFNQATRRNAFQLNLALTITAFAVCGAHLATAVVGDPKSTLVQFAQSFIWVPMLVGFATLASFLISKESPRRVDQPA